MPGMITSQALDWPGVLLEAGKNDVAAVDDVVGDRHYLSLNVDTKPLTLEVKGPSGFRQFTIAPLSVWVSPGRDPLTMRLNSALSYLRVAIDTLHLGRLMGRSADDVPPVRLRRTFGVAAPEDREVVGRLALGVVSSVPPGQHAGNLDLRELQEGSALYIPVWQPGAKIFTGDSHALQADGEVNLTALETGMREVRVQVHLHERPGWEWPFAETDTHWIALGLHRDLNQACRIALRNALDFLSQRAGLSRLDAYALASLAVHFRITEVVDVNQGVHAMIPKEIFARDLRETIRVV